MVRLLIGSAVAALAMFIIGFVFFATPLVEFAFTVASPDAQATLQQALKDNLPSTGTYAIPWPESAAGQAAYQAGPIATIHYNSGGFAVADPQVMLWGYVHMLVSILLVGLALWAVRDRLTTRDSRTRLVLLFALAASIFMHLGKPIWYHHDWPFELYLGIADFVALAVGGWILARWFVPTTH